LNEHTRDVRLEDYDWSSLGDYVGFEHASKQHALTPLSVKTFLVLLLGYLLPGVFMKTLCILVTKEYSNVYIESKRVLRSSCCFSQESQNTWFGNILYKASGIIFECLKATT
jgi:hypothetical protein